jgi:hypothetical protein
MQRSAIAFAAMFFCTSYPTIARQGSSYVSSPQQPRQIDQTVAMLGQDCSRRPGATNEPSRDMNPGPDPEAVQLPPAPETIGDRENSSNVNLDRDLKILQHGQSRLAQCILASDPDGEEQDSQPACLGELLMNFEMRHDGEPERDIPIGRLQGTSAFFYDAGMTIDADGAPNAYHPENVGLDDLANAGTPGRWEGLAKDSYGEPYIQGPDDPFPGFYVSETALADRSKPANDPTRYVDASRIPFVVLPGGMARQLGARPGDFAVVFNQRNGKSSYAIFGDVGPFDRIGEGSMALAENLGIRSDARNGGARRGVLYLIFPGSGNGRPRALDEISAEGQRLLLEWETSIASSECAIQRGAEEMEGNHGAN